MVQRKLPTKLGLQADRAKRESLWQHRDVKTRGGSADLKKKMKKSRSIKRTELESTQRVNQTQLGKLPPAIAHLTGAATPQKHSPVSSMAATPNYMKSTTSSDARKEQSQVSSKIPRTRSSPDISSLHTKGSSSLKLTTLGSGNKATKISARTSNLKTVRSLTKNPSFKQARTCVRKCSPAVLCENFDVQKATCSSTLKDFKFPAYLTLNPGGTESEGTSAIKVCPYAYCSLNGHHHPPLPALEAFFSAKRCAVKTQRGMKLGCLSPRRVKPVGDSGTDEEHADFFIEIFTKKGEGTTGHRGTDGTGSFLPSVDGGNEAAAEDQGEQVLETLSDAPTCYDVDAPEIPDIGTTHLAPLIQEVKLDSEASDIDCEADHHSALYFHYDYEYPPEIAIEPELEGVEGQIIQDKFIIGSDNIGGCLNEFFVDEVSQESSNEESFFLDAFSSSDDSESNGLNESLQSLVNMESSAPVKVPVEEQEPIDDDKNKILFGCDQTPETDPPIGSQFTGYHIIAEEGSSFNNRKCKSFQSEDSVALTGIQASNLDKTVISGCKAMHNSTADNVLSNQSSSDEGYRARNELADGDHTGNTESQGNSADNFITTWSLTDPAIERIVGVAWQNSTEAECHLVHKIQEENATKPEIEDSAVAQATAKFKKPTEEKDELGLFNPRAPNFLPLEPEPEAEKVDLRHQELDERKNTEEWMVDYALRQAVTKLGPARKRKVALLVEAFEKVMPTTKCDLPLKHTSAWGHATPIQACR